MDKILFAIEKLSEAPDAESNLSFLMEYIIDRLNEIKEKVKKEEDKYQ